MTFKIALTTNAINYVNPFNINPVIGLVIVTLTIVFHFISFSLFINQLETSVR